MKTLAEFKVEDILPSISGGGGKKKVCIKGVVYRVGISSHRLRCFKNNLSCVKCGITGTKFLLQYVGQEPPHFNLYAEKDGELILMTKDHIIPVSKGGKDSMTNYQTMCYPCNYSKANSL